MLLTGQPGARTAPRGACPSYGVPGRRYARVAGSTTPDSSGANAHRSASAPTAIRPLAGSPGRSAGARAAHRTTYRRPDAFRRTQSRPLYPSDTGLRWDEILGLQPRDITLALPTDRRPASGNAPAARHLAVGNPVITAGTTSGTPTFSLWGPLPRTAQSPVRDHGTPTITLNSRSPLPSTGRLRRVRLARIATTTATTTAPETTLGR